MTAIHATRLAHEHRGAILVELIFTLPLLLLFIWFFIYFGIVYNAKSSLIAAMDNSLQTGMLRGYFSNTLDHRMLYDKLDDLCNYQQDSTLDSILYYKTGLSNAERSDFIANYNQTTAHWAGWTTDFVDEADFCSQPLHNIYAVVFTQLAMQKSLGAAVKFPCNPADDTAQTSGEGCLRCIPLNPCTMDTTQVDPASGGNGCNITTIFHRVALSCEYRPASVFVKPIDLLVRLLSAGQTSTNSTVSYKAYYDIPMDFDWNFGQ